MFLAFLQDTAKIGGRRCIQPSLETTMRKIRLDPEELLVEAFSTSEIDGEPGTVRGHDAQFLESTFDPNSLSGWNNCYCPRQYTSPEC
jgi:hypothetical protein